MYNLLPNTIVFVDFGFYKHYGLSTERFYNGKPTIISNSFRKMGVYEESWDDFSCGKDVQILEYTSSLNPDVILSRARSKLGTKWNLLTWNCEHFVNWSHGLKTHSPQLNTYATCVSVIVGSVILLKTIKTKSI